MMAHFGNSLLMGVPDLSLCPWHLRPDHPNCAGSFAVGAIPTQRESTTRAPGTPAHNGTDPRAVTYTSLPGGPLAPGAARRFARAGLAEWTRLALPGAEHLTEGFTDDVLVVVSELVTNAVVHAGTDVELLCRLEFPEHPDEESVRVIVEVSDHHPARAVRDDRAERPYGTEPSFGTSEYGRGLRLVSALSDAWGITYRTGAKTVWARLPVDGGTGFEERTKAYTGEAAPDPGLGVADILAPAPKRSLERDEDWLNRGALSFLAEASDLLAGQLDEDLVAALAGQLLVPRLADWCAVWLEDEGMGWRGAEGGSHGSGPRLARVWHVSEDRVEDLRCALQKNPPRLPDSVRSRAVTVAWPDQALGGRGETGTALAYRLIAGGRPLGTLVIGRAGTPRFADEVTGLVEDLSRRVALAVGAARQYARQATISRILQRGLLPGAVAEIPGLHSALVYEPCDKGGPSGDFYDLFPAGDGRWCFALGDVQGKGPEAAVVIGLARPWLRLLAREGYQVAEVLDRLNQLLLDDATETADAAARALVTAGGPGLGADEGPQTRFLSLLFGELVPFDGGVRCTLASAGHPLPLVLSPDGRVRTVAEPQTLLGVIEDTEYISEVFELYSGDTLLCVTDGVTERRCGTRMFDDGDGLAAALTGCAGLNAELVAERIRRLVHQFGSKPPEDDLALLVLQAE
jgi:serine phosphatase RsbU (regulator of sigma subunit)/anti-sigma regulatory factor (Ser/Thr protein kinase)